MNGTEEPMRCLVVGAGIAGLLAARTLREQGLRVTVLDKGRGVGGRMATRRIGAAVFDHGAQFFTVRDSRFAALVSTWLSAEVAVEWCRGFADAEGAAAGDGHPRYRGKQGMTAVPKHLALGLDVLLGQRVTSVEAQGARWSVRTHVGARYTADALVLTAPVPQSLAVLEAGSTALPAEPLRALQAIGYDPCLALLIQPTKSAVPAPGGMHLAGEPLSWIADNRQKGISAREAVTLHAGAGFSRAHWDTVEHEVVSLLLSAAAVWLSEAALLSEPAADIQVHRWRYAKPATLHPDSCLSLTEPLPLVFAGDAFGTPRVEGAALSGLAAAQAVLDALRIRRR